MVFLRTQNNTDHWEMNVPIFDNLSITEDGNFISTNTVGNSWSSGVETSNQTLLCFNRTYTVLQILLNANALDGPSVNFVTMRLNEAPTLLVLTVPDIVTGRIFVIAAIEGLEGQRESLQWNSDSVGVAAIRSVGAGGRY